MIDKITEAILSVLTLAGYFMVTHGVVYFGAWTALVSNVLWVFYGNQKNSPSIMIVNLVFAMININLLGN
jgi:hypothetical protein